jgi:L-threonylcarbamoyladenylate synthase
MFELDDIHELLRILNNGGLILYPTDTIWGIGCDATNETAVARIYALKQRMTGKGYVLLADNMAMINDYVEHFHPKVQTLLSFHTRPLTLIYDKGINLPDNTLAPDGSVAFRIPQDRFCKDLIHYFGKPLVATSANISNEPFPSFFGEISSAIISGVDYVVRYRRDDKIFQEPSIIARLGENEELEFLRH